jgi:hypothetical protein
MGEQSMSTLTAPHQRASRCHGETCPAAANRQRRPDRSPFGPVRLAYQPPANSTFLLEQTSHQQPASSTLLSEQTSTSHQPPANRTGCSSGRRRADFPHTARDSDFRLEPDARCSFRGPAASRPSSQTRPKQPEGTLLWDSCRYSSRVNWIVCYYIFHVFEEHYYYSTYYACVITISHLCEECHYVHLKPYLAHLHAY